MLYANQLIDCLYFHKVKSRAFIPYLRQWMNKELRAASIPHLWSGCAHAYYAQL
uniref:Uncharacterized protein n=1 Tax=Arundo donax TaxID=35708 RepID=A0A0A8XPP6_ARUDO